MQYKELDDLYQTRRTPWVPIILVLLVIGVGLALILRPRGPVAQKKETEPETTTVAAAEATGSDTGAVAADSREAESGATPFPNDELQRIETEVAALEKEDKLEEAREKLLAVLEDKRALGNRRVRIEGRAGAINIRLALSRRPMQGKIRYTIKSGDSLSRIAARFNCPAEFIQEANRISNPSLIRPGDTLLVLEKPEFLIEVDKQANTLLLTLGGRFFKRYRVGTGQYDSTPVGTFIVRDKIIEPPWWHASGRVIPFGDPENILGTRWMALEASGDTPAVRGYGIHGTWEDSSIGKASSAGCIRMLNKEVEELYMFIPRGAPVIIK